MAHLKRSLLALVLAVVLCSFVFAQAAPAEPLVMATATRLSGSFFTSQFGDNTADTEVRKLLFGYPTTVFTSQNRVDLNRTVVANAAESEQDGLKVFTITLKDGLLFDDGSPITAQHYVFSLLLQASPAMRSLGGSPLDLSYLNGFEAYASGEADSFAGIRLLDDSRFSLTLSPQALPNYYQTAYLQALPYPMSVLAPDTQVQDSEAGAKLEPAPTAELLQQTIMAPETGYLVHPVPAAGPYQLSGFDAAAGQASFVLNPHFVGDYTGKKPTIPALRIIQAAGRDALDGLRRGSIDVLHKAVDGALIAQAQQMQGIEQAPYARRGFAYFAFDASQGPAASKAVRQAFAYCVDSRRIASEYTKGFGWPVYADYGFGHWAAAQWANVRSLVDLPSPSGWAFAAFDALPLAQYLPNVAKAASLLDADGWNLDAAGQPYEPGKGGVRHRKTDQGLEALELRWLQAEGSRLNQLALFVIEENCQKAGIGLVMTQVSQEQFFEAFYGREPKGFNLFLLASNFPATYDPLPLFNASASMAYSLGTQDSELIRLADELHKTPEGDNATYLARFIAYQTYYNEALPTVPVYSNVYFDFYQNGIRNYKPELHDSFAQAILYAAR